MSYIRNGYPLRYVEGNSKDYVFCSCAFKDMPSFIEDYGKITNEGIIELLFDNWETEDIMFKEHLLKRLSENLKVKLRDKPLTVEEVFKLMDENLKEFKKTDFYKSFKKKVSKK